MLILLKKYASTNCLQIVSKCYTFCVNFYIIFMPLSITYSFCVKLTKIWMGYLGHVKCVKLDTNFSNCVIAKKYKIYSINYICIFFKPIVKKKSNLLYIKLYIKLYIFYI